MSRYVIEVDSPEEEARLLAALSELNVRVIGQPAEKIVPKKSLAEVIGHLSRSSIAEKFGDPSAWQREIRSWDRVLYGREE